jgi:uncharacterized membrane protein
MGVWIRQATGLLANAIDIVAAIVIAWAAIGAAWRLLRREGDGPEPVRLQLARWMLLGLEFLLAADILRSTVSPTWNELGQLAAVVVIRTVLDYFLMRDIEVADRRAGQRSLP